MNCKNCISVTFLILKTGAYMIFYNALQMSKKKGFSKKNVKTAF